MKHAQSPHQSSLHFPKIWSLVPFASGADGAYSLALSTSPSPREHGVLPQIDVRSLMRSRLLPGNGRLSCCAGLLPFTSGARPAQLSACPGPPTPGQARAAAGSHSLAAGDSLHGGQSWVGDSTWACPGLRAKSQEEGAPPAVHLTPQLSLRWWAGTPQALKARGGSPPRQRSRCLKGEGPSFRGSP